MALLASYATGDITSKLPNCPCVVSASYNETENAREGSFITISPF